MNNLKKLLAAGLALSLSLSLAACGGGTATPSEAAPSEAAPASEAAGTESVPDAAPTEAVTLKVGASPAPHAEILEQVKPILAEQGINLEIVEFTDYVLPNNALDAGDIDANYFQHKPYLDDFNVKNETKLASAAAIHFEPLGLYAGKTATVEALPDGGSIGVPNDATNEARALLLLEKLGLIKLEEGAGLSATPLNITENPKNIKFQEMEAVQLPSVLPDVDLAVINGNYAVGANIMDKVITSEDKESEAAKEFANIVAVREGDESRPEIKALVAALQSEEIVKFINEKYNGLVISVL